MRHTIITICLALLSLTARGQAAPAATGQGAQGNAPGKSPDITFAWLSDVHLNSFAYAEDDLRQAIEDINAMPGVQFVILSGDLTEFGDTEEFRFMRDILQNFNKPYLLVTGNHDVNWSENGCTAFVDFLGAPHFCYDCQGVRFIGCGAGPALRMGPPQIPREEVVWLDSVVAATPKDMPVIFVNHFPLNRDLSNWYEVVDILKTRDIRAVLAGHLHVNRPYDAEGIPGFIGRSSLRRTDPIGGYNLVHVWGDSITVRERIIKTETRPAWGRAAFAPLAERTDTVYQRPDYSVNDAYPSVRVLWRLNDVTDVASQGSVDGSFYVYTNTAGVVRALDVADGRELWTFATGDKVFSAPFITPDKVIVSSCDGALYALSRKDGSLVWRQDTGYPIVACPLVADGHVYLGSSNGKFYSFNLEDGTPEWMCTGLQGYMESRPAVDAERVYTGTWGAKFYAMDRKTGAKAWEFDTGKGRYFSPGACWPVVLSYEKDGRRGEQVIVLSSDYFVRAFNPADGKILWASDEAKGRESLGFSPDGKTMYVKGIGNNLTAVDVSRGIYSPLWTVEMPYKGNFIPTRMPATGKLVFVPTEFGVVHAVRTDGSGLEWSYKVSHSAVTSLCDVGQGRLVVMTMDGTVACLDYGNATF